MASKHEVIVDKVIVDWSLNRRGRLYKMKQGLAIPINSDTPVWFGPLTRRFKGFSDIFGFEYDTRYMKPIPVFCAIEVKTKAYSKLSPEQIDFLNYIVQIGGRAYVAMETDEGYELREWEVE